MVRNRQRRVRVSTAGLSGFSRRACAALGLRESELAICLVSDKAIAGWNHLYRGKSAPTDVLSFPTESRGGAGRRKRSSRAAARKRRGGENAGAERYLGDIAIAPGVARRNARAIGRTLDGELRVLILHGMLHLMGYDHETDKGEMQREERRLRRRLGIG